MNEIEQNVDTTMTVAPDNPDSSPPTRADAGTDESIAERLERNPQSKEARLDRALDESMDASDPPATTQPVHNHEPAPSSGYDEDAERKLQSGD
ncbi:hypothetical protein SAMN06297144_0504 [Sphingomonas guangdongensis]|uniref:Uncharacterized protein n=1 Tax=Sphingomonas guangdongensis TaxID=1141890 RepID=A0A285QBT6_9SPHN|nr:hypothetical protein [Sphingomonas guangdongensis]SOB79353.1 hypothetical protein SAMN06297144_0504 [Sphingomonas guangdongensis]